MTIKVCGLRDKAICVVLKRRMFNPHLTDRNATAVAESALGTRGAGKFRKELLKGCAELREVQRKFTALYEYVRDNTLPWMDEGMRVLPNENYIGFANEISHLRSDCMNAVEKLADVWDAAVANDANTLGSVFNPNDYPSASQMKELWGIRVTFCPVPSATDFRCDMDEQDMQNLEDEIRTVESNATEHLMRELFNPIKAMADKLGEDPGKRKSPIFRDTLVSNVWDICRRAKGLNINHDPRIDEIISETEGILKNVDAQILREIPEVREHVQDEMSKLENKLSQWF